MAAARKIVTIQYRIEEDGPGGQEKKLALCEYFKRAASEDRETVLNVYQHGFYFAANRQDFLALVDKGVFLPSVVEAFQKADQGLSKYDQARGSFGARLWDSFRHHHRMQQGLPLASCKAPIADMDGVNVTVSRYDLADRPKPA